MDFALASEWPVLTFWRRKKGVAGVLTSVAFGIGAPLKGPEKTAVERTRDVIFFIANAFSSVSKWLIKKPESCSKAGNN